MLKTAKKRRLFLLLALCAALVLGCAVYVGDYYRADETALAALQSSGKVTAETSSDSILFIPAAEPVTGFIFYPGGKVEHTAYAPLLQELAQNGILCVLLEIPFRLAVLDMNAAEGIPTDLASRFPTVTDWYLGGHSLGGSMAAIHLSKTLPDSPYQGLVLLASYSTADVSAFPVISLYGTEDQVLNFEKYAKYRSNLPGDTVEIPLEGGNHANFGSYGFQKGDGMASLSAAEQLEMTVQYLLEFFGK